MTRDEADHLIEHVARNGQISYARISVSEWARLFDLARLGAKVASPTHEERSKIAYHIWLTYFTLGVPDSGSLERWNAAQYQVEHGGPADDNVRLALHGANAALLALKDSQ